MEKNNVNILELNLKNLNRDLENCQKELRHGQDDQKRKENHAEDTYHLRFDREKNQLINEINVLERRLEDQLCDFDKQKENIRHDRDSDNEQQCEVFTERFDNLKRIYLEQNEQLKLLSADFENERNTYNSSISKNIVLLKDTQVDIYICIYIYVCVCVCVCAYECTFVYKYLYIYI
jgi:hypothetical protein